MADQLNSEDYPMKASNAPAHSGTSAVPLLEESLKPGALQVRTNFYQYPATNPGGVTVLDQDPSVLLERHGRRAQRLLLRAWAEFFWVLSLPVLFVSTFLQSLMRGTLLNAVVPAVIHPLQLLGDHFIKPLLVTLYDAWLLPVATCAANVAQAGVLVARPLSEQLMLLLAPLAHVLGSLRCIQITYHVPPQSGTKGMYQEV